MKRIGTLARLRALVRGGESETLEFKETTAELRAGFEHFCSLLNHKGGYLLFGVKPSGALSGQQVADNTRRDIADQIVKLEPVVNPEQSEILATPGRLVIVVHADPDPGAVPYTYDGRPWERVGTTARKMTQRRYEELLERRRDAASPWENQPARGVKPADLDAKRIRLVAKTGGYPHANSAPVATLLASMGGLRQGKINRAAIVAFGRTLLPDYPQCRVRLARFVGTKMGAAFLEPPREVVGNIFDLFEAAEAFVWRHVPRPSEVSPRGMRRIVRELIPKDALREVLVNALTHRDYAQPGASVGLAIFDDRVEIENPGTFPPTIDPTRFFSGAHPTLPRNPLVAGIVHRTDLMEKWGTGGVRILRACKAAGTRPPRIVVEPGAVRVIFRATLPQTTRVARTTQVAIQVTPKVFAVLRRALRGSVAAETLRAATGLKSRKQFRVAYLEPLLDRGWLERTIPEHPTSRMQRYRLTSAGRARIRGGLPKSVPK